jgi:UDP-N-acetylmuramate: L-alanyl-gamma-D-glutamyl-meso-diaminopimelate ligase
MSDSRHFHLIGICGTAMASLAGMLRARGFRVTGSDAAAYPPMSDFLAAQGVAVQQPFAEANLEPAPDVVVVGNAISRGNVELEYALDHGLPLASLPQLLHDEFLVGRKTLVVAGTHGKTTTTSMLAWIFHTAGKRPSFLIGGIAENFGSSFTVNDSEFFIIEGDEYDSAFFDKGPKFLHYFPSAAILTSVEFDHADIYKDLDAVKIAFQRLVNLVPRSGRILAWDGADSTGTTAASAQTNTSSNNIDACVARAFCPVERYGFSERASWRIVDVNYRATRTTWTVLHDGKPWADLEFALAGQYNVLNATAAAAMAANCGIAIADIAEALRSYKSVKRRLEVKAEVAGITIIDDFAHHPTAIAESLKALRTRYAGRRLWAIFEPRSNTLRRAIFQRELTASLALADEIVIAAIFKPEAIAASDRLNVDAVVAELQRMGRSAVQLADAAAIVEESAPRMCAGDVVAILSNGGFGGIYEKLPARLRALGSEQQPKSAEARVKS